MFEWVGVMRLGVVPLFFILTHESTQWYSNPHTNLFLSIQTPSFPLTSPQSPGIMTSSIGMLLRLCAGEKTSHTQLFVLLFLSYMAFLLFFFFVVLSLVFANTWNHEGMTSKGGIFEKMLHVRWKIDTISTLEPCTVLFPVAVQFSVPLSSSLITVVSLGLTVFTSAIRVFCIILASTYLILTFDKSIA